MIKKRTTVYLPDKLIKLLKVRAIKNNQSVSDYINQVVSRELLEEEEDLADIQKILKEPTVPFEQLLKDLNITDAVSH